jgi:hypothetical protein
VRRGFIFVIRNCCRSRPDPASGELIGVWPLLCFVAPTPVSTFTRGSRAISKLLTAMKRCIVSPVCGPIWSIPKTAMLWAVTRHNPKRTSERLDCFIYLNHMPTGCEKKSGATIGHRWQPLILTAPPGRFHANPAQNIIVLARSALERASFAGLFALAGWTELRVIRSLFGRYRGTLSLPGGARMRGCVACFPLGGLDATKTHSGS